MPPKTGWGVNDNCFVRYYVDDGLTVEVQWYPSGIRCLMTSASLVSEHFRLFDERSARDPPLLSAQKVSSWDTRLEVLGWEIDTLAMTITAVREVDKICDLLREWPADRFFASKICYLCVR